MLLKDKPKKTRIHIWVDAETHKKLIQLGKDTGLAYGAIVDQLVAEATAGHNGA